MNMAKIAIPRYDFKAFGGQSRNAPCVDSGIAYDDFTETVERIQDVFLVCFCAIHRNFPLPPTWGGAWFVVSSIIQMAMVL
jgi:hypothetical protein